MSEQMPQNLSRQTLQTGRFLSLQEIDWQDADGNIRHWESAERVGGNTAIVIIPWLRPSNTLVLIRQYRPPVEGMIIEFPAGLIDHGESPAKAAIRELREETGYKGTINNILPPTFNSPGLSGEAVYHVRMDIAESAAANQYPMPKPDAGEFIQTVLVPGKKVGAFMREELAAGTHFDSKVMSYLTGIIHAEGLSVNDGGLDLQIPTA